MYRREKNHGFAPAALFEEYYSNDETIPAFAARLNLTTKVLNGIIGQERKRRGLN